jgi:hypothetical protein
LQAEAVIAFDVDLDVFRFAVLGGVVAVMHSDIIDELFH